MKTIKFTRYIHIIIIHITTTKTYLYANTIDIGDGNSIELTSIMYDNSGIPININKYNGFNFSTSTLFIGYSNTKSTGMEVPLENDSSCDISGKNPRLDGKSDKSGTRTH